MGELAVAAATSHAPGIAGSIEAAGDRGQRFHAGLTKIRETFDDAQPDVIIELSNEHFVNFYLHNMPAICVGTGMSFIGPVEPGVANPEAFLKIPQSRVEGHPSLAKDIVRGAYAGGVDVAYSEDLVLDHGFMVPLHFITPNLDVPVVPIFVNNLIEPMPLPQRLYQLGKVLRQVIASRPQGERIAIIGAGGISHWVGTPETGRINVDFDDMFLENSYKGRGEDLSELTPEQIGEGGSGAHEVRNWLGVMGAMGDESGEVVAYEPVVQWATGCGAILWKT